MRRYTHDLRVVLSPGVADRLAAAARSAGVPMALLVRYAVQPDSWRDMQSSRRPDPSSVDPTDARHGPDRAVRRVAVPFTDDEWEVLTRAAWKAGVSRSSWAASRLEAVLDDDPMGLVEGLTSSWLRANAARLLAGLASHRGSPGGAGHDAGGDGA